MRDEETAKDKHEFRPGADEYTCSYCRNTPWHSWHTGDVIQTARQVAERLSDGNLPWREWFENRYGCSPKDWGAQGFHMGDSLDAFIGGRTSRAPMDVVRIKELESEVERLNRVVGFYVSTDTASEHP